jgi:REP element-mobilizing transposase RayT
MSSTYVSLNYHIVFSTKNRIPHITDLWRDELHKYLAGTTKGLGAHPIEIGGIADHVHMLVSLTQTHCIKDFMREVKKESSKWVHAQVRVPAFQWQDGYAAFTVSPSGRAAATRYVRNQAEHHRTKSYIEELKELLGKAGINYDPRYLV